jgi:hypothetical protein
MYECFPENIHDDSDVDYDFVYDSPAVGEYDSLFNPQKLTTDIFTGLIMEGVEEWCGSQARKLDNTS